MTLEFLTVYIPGFMSNFGGTIEYRATFNHPPNEVAHLAHLLRCHCRAKRATKYIYIYILCKKEAEDEKHFLISCSVYQELRKSLFECLSKLVYCKLIWTVLSMY